MSSYLGLPTFPVPISVGASIADLPIELHEQIIGYLPWLDQLSCEHVCKVWREVIRKRLSPPRYAIAPWLPPQSYAFAAYAPLQIHTLLIEGKAKTLSYKCHESYRISQTPFLDEEEIRMVWCISQLNVIEKNIQPNEYLTSTRVTNLSLLNDMIVLPALIEDDEIKTLGCRSSRKLPEYVRQTGQNNDDSSDEEGDEDEDDNATTTANAPTTATEKADSKARVPINPANGYFNCDVAPSADDWENAFSMMTLGKLLLHIRENLLNDLFREKGVNETTYPEDWDAEKISKKQQIQEKQKRDLENATIVVSGLHFERSGVKNKLQIVYDAMVIPEKGGKGKKTMEAPITIDTTKEVVMVDAPEQSDSEEEEEE
ncbi:hypothetical protein ABW19_dt0206168 [Dactylella cylindrospora]|nr:hypothetical protein ABW19_dt0206168 [Dactylella cylindrospora]